MADWQTENAAYLERALAWLRQVLKIAVEIEGAGESAASESGLAAEVLEVDADSEFVPALVLLGRWFGLSMFEQKLLLLCAALELDAPVASLCAQVQQTERQPYPTFALAMSLFDDPEWPVTIADGSLRYWQLIDVTTSPTIPLTLSPLRADMRIVHFLKGVNQFDSRLSALVRPMRSPPGTALVELPPSQQATVKEAIAALERSQQQLDTPLVVQLLGTDAASQEQAALAIAQQIGMQLYRLPVVQLPVQASELMLLARLWERETRLLRVALYCDGTEIEPNGAAANALRQFIDRCGGVCFVAIAGQGLALGGSAATVEVAKPTALEQRQAWEACLGEGAAEVAGQLASQFRLNLTEIHEIAATPTESTAELWAACLEKTRPNLDNLAQRLEVKATWEDLVLPAAETETLQQIAAQVRQRSQVYEDWGFRQKLSRGLGVSALFAGPSGTGKTMAAEVIANALQLHLYRIDLSAVTSKYIGETEKNLRKLFDAAEDGGAILFFDEADALFGKRSEVKDSHDRHANIEINYLLQRLEAFGGLSILATNFRNALDPAFVRRLRFIVTFPSPGREERLRLWQKVFPVQTPLADLDYERLARLNLTGGNIHTVAINAAFLAAAEKTPVTMAHVLTAAKGEYRKLERPFGGEDWRL